MQYSSYIQTKIASTKQNSLSLLCIFLTNIISTFAQINPTGETWVYKISKDGSEVAEIICQTDKQIHTLNQSKCYKITTRARISALFGIANIENQITSWVEKHSFKTQKVHIYYNDGKNPNNYILQCNPKQRQIEAYKLENPEEKKFFSWFAECEDLWSLFFQIRQKDFSKLQPNNKFSFCVMTNENKTTEIILKYLGKKEISFGNQSKECYIVTWVAPTIKEIDAKSIRIAITTDPYQIPAKMYLKSTKGFFVTELKSFNKN